MTSISGTHGSGINVGQANVSPTLPEQADEFQNHINPARAARAAQVDRPDLAGRPFGSLVSLFAKGLPLPPLENTEETGTPPITEPTEELPAETV